jgi:dTDP-4-amino-4,6-dideoxygalactose transaminase
MADNRNIPFLDLITPHLELEAELVSAFRNALKTASFIGGPAVENFERDFASYCEATQCVGVSSGTDALRFALTAAGVRPGDTVLTVANTFIATTEAISQAGARPDFIDVDERTYNLDPEKLGVYLETKCAKDPQSGRLVNKRTGSPVTAVVPVHLYGQMADMDSILDLAAQHGLLVIEDACQAHGAEYYSRKEQRWRKAGSIGAAAAFSFYPGKNLGACGEAGAITTNDEQVAKICRMLRDHGQSKKYYHDMEGYNGRLDAIQAGLLHVKLRHLPDWTEQRRACAAEYDDLFARAGRLLVAPHVPEWSRPVYHLYVVRVADREAVQKELTAAGVGTGIHYPIPLHLSTPYASLGFRLGDLPVTERAAAEVLSLPLFPNLSVENQRRVAFEVLGTLRRRGTVREDEVVSAQAAGVTVQPRG